MEPFSECITVTQEIKSINDSCINPATTARPEGFNRQIRYIRRNTIADAIVAIIARFHDTSPDKKRPPDHTTWDKDEKIGDSRGAEM